MQLKRQRLATSNFADRKSPEGREEEKMTGGTSHGDRFSKPTEEELERLLIEEFYKDAVARYGSDSEQACAFSRLLMSWRS
jgi:hypothetical protein